MADNKESFDIIELFMAQADRDRRFYGTIKRSQDLSGHPVVYGEIKVLDGFICAQAGNQDELGQRLDELVKIRLDEGLHDIAGIAYTVAGFECLLN